jgi:hypothetical protein
VSVPRKDGEEFFTLASKIPLKTSVRTFPLAEANAALDAVREGRLEGAAVLTVAYNPLSGNGYRVFGKTRKGYTTSSDTPRSARK